MTDQPDRLRRPRADVAGLSTLPRPVIAGPGFPLSQPRESEVLALAWRPTWAQVVGVALMAVGILELVRVLSWVVEPDGAWGWVRFLVLTGSAPIVLGVFLAMAVLAVLGAVVGFLVWGGRFTFSLAVISTVWMAGVVAVACA
jgi:hypothetical protein